MTVQHVVDRAVRDDLQHQFPVLDTMRAVGALFVLATHCAFNAGAYGENGAFGRLLARMDVGVAIFFVLSGFLLSRAWLVRARRGEGPPPLGRYFWKRFLRIVPPYVVVAVCALALIESNRGIGTGGWVAALTMTDIYASDRLPYGLTQTWSLATEVAFYVVLPLVMLAAVGRGRLRPGRVAVVLLVLVGVNVVWLLGGSARVPVDNGHVNEWLPAYLTWFSAGIALALVQVTPDRQSRVRRLLRDLAASPGVCWTLVVGLMLVAGTSVAGPMLLVPATQGEALTKNLLYAAIGMLVVLPGALPAGESRYSRVMSHAALRHLGYISYGIFLVHMSILHFVMWWTGYELFEGHFVQIFVLTLVLSLIASEALYRVVEVPCQRLKGLGRKSAATTTATDSAVTTR
jgi:peptidoglycan/LPS O-acetylase OafA/YrhL